MTWTPKHLTREQMAERRQTGVRLLKAGDLSQAEIARQLGVSEAAVSVWNRKLKQFGSKSLRARKATGRPPRLSKPNQQQLLKTLRRGAPAAGFETARWTQARVHHVITKQFGIRYHPNYISRLLHNLGWSVQKPETRARERDEILIRNWLRKDWVRIKKSAATRRRNSL